MLLYSNTLEDLPVPYHSVDNISNRSHSRAHDDVIFIYKMTSSCTVVKRDTLDAIRKDFHQVNFIFYI